MWCAAQIKKMASSSASSNSNPLKWGILGAGLISHDFMLGLATLPSSKHQVVAVGDNFSKEDAQNFAQTHSIPRWYASHQELLADKEVEVVYIGTLHIAHRNNTLEALEAGKHVLCEKPMTMYPTHTSELITKAKECGLFLMEATWMRFFPAVVELREMIARGDIGEVRWVRANFSFRRPPERDKGRLTDPQLGGGAVFDVGVYTISLATMLFGGKRPVTIHAQGSTLPTGVDDLAVMTLTYSDGGIAQLSASISYAMSCDAVVCGTKGELRLPHPFWCSTKLETPDAVYETEKVSKEWPLPRPHLPGNYPNPTGLRYEAEEVYSCLRTEPVSCESHVMPLEQSLIVAEVAEEVIRQVHRTT